jgi:acyl-CoA hydrolase
MSQEMEPRSPAASESFVSELMMPHQVNNHGHVFGGVVLSMVDRVAGVASMRHSGMPCVTVSFDKVDFKEPIFTGEVVTCKARVNFVGRTSMEIGVRVEAENLFTREKRHTNTCYVTFVAIDANHRPVPVPPLKLETDEDRRRLKEGQKRREARISLARELEDT